MFAYIGMFFIVPSMVSLSFVIIMAVAMHLMATDEERFVAKKLGNEYMNRVKRRIW
ncbi:MAG: hypothetical protein HKN68_11620 [Saprospiraceae bacterium]|nr:hypothetical protein [Saprospiraceae bacterium]